MVRRAETEKETAVMSTEQKITEHSQGLSAMSYQTILPVTVCEKMFGLRKTYCLLL